MAAVQRAARVSEEEKPLSFVPGSNRRPPFMKRGTVPGPKTRPGTEPETRPTTRLGPRQNSPGGSGPEEMASHRSHTCLKDLCPEDKKRISNLIKELARVSEEQEVSTQRFRDEQSQFVHKIQSLEQQNQMIAMERESLQQQYRECQELLKLHQLYLLERTHKLEQSHYPSHNSTQVTGQELAAPVCDGSYLSLAPPDEQQEHYQRTSSQPPAPPTSSLSSSDQCLCGKEPTKSPHLESQHWHHKKCQLLKQKLTLEEERDRLQRRLTEHEERRRLTEHEERRRLTEHEERRRLTEQHEERRRLTEQHEERRRLTEQQEERRRLTEQQEEQRRLTEQQEERRRLTEQQEEQRRLTEQQEEQRRLTEQQEEQTGSSEKMQCPQKARKSTDVHLSEPSGSRELRRRDIGKSPDPHTTPKARPVRSSTNKQRAGSASCSGPTPADLEESRILEDIFFIC